MSSTRSTRFPVAGRTKLMIKESEGISMNKNLTKPLWSYIGFDDKIETLQRMSRRCNANNFRREYKFVDGKKICLSSDGSTYCWSDKCYDKIWVGVHGKESICMVTLKEDVDMTRVAPFYQQNCLNHQTMRSYASAIISEVECIPYDEEFRQRFCNCIKKPFGVVSVIPCTVHEGSGHEASSAEYDEEKAIIFLMEKMKSGSTFTFDETVQTAISVFQHLCRKELKAEDIWVSTAWNVDSHSEHMRLPERKEYLDISSGASSGEGRPPKVHQSFPTVPAGTPNRLGWYVGVTPVNNLIDVHKYIPYSMDRPCSTRGGGCSSSDDDDDDGSGLFTVPKKSVPNAGVGIPFT